MLGLRCSILDTAIRDSCASEENPVPAHRDAASRVWRAFSSLPSILYVKVE